MAIVFIPPELRTRCGGHRSLSVGGRTVGELIDGLEKQFPGVAARLVSDGELKPGLAVTIDNDVSSLGIDQRVTDSTEVHFLPAIGGG